MPTRTTDLIPINAESSVPTPDASTADYARSISRRIHALTLFILLAALIGFSLFAMQAFETRMAPEIGKKSATIGRILAAQIERAVGYGIPFAKLVGMGPFLASVFPDNPEVAYLLVADATGAILYAEPARFCTLPAPEPPKAKPLWPVPARRCRIQRMRYPSGQWALFTTLH